MGGLVIPADESCLLCMPYGTTPSILCRNKEMNTKLTNAVTLKGRAPKMLKILLENVFHKT